MEGHIVVGLQIRPVVYTCITASFNPLNPRLPFGYLGSVLESELGQKWRYGALKACIG